MHQDLLLSYYGDDLTGSTDAMEALSVQGLDVVLFTRRPTEGELARFPSCDVIGLAGTSRSRPPAWMDEFLTKDLTWLHALDAPLCHYKVCSTFNSSPQIGSIGCAIDIGHRLFGQAVTPLIVGTPQLRRYTIFGNHFATVGGETYRLDRHPIMSRHPVTPMHEADLRRHLAGQTAKRIGLASIVDLKAPDVEARIDHIASACDILLFDIADDDTQATAGRMLWRMRKPGGAFVCGSSGVEYALVREWSRQGLLRKEAHFSAPDRLEQIAVISGSCAPATANQIRTALGQGFEHVAVDVLALGRKETARSERNRVIGRALAVLGAGGSPIVATSLGPESVLSEAAGLSPPMRDSVGHQLGLILGDLVREAKLQRAVLAGGNLSSHALCALDLYALTTRLPLPEAPGAPLCIAHASAGPFDGLEIALKGGQMGKDSYFVDMRNGVF